MSHIQHNDNDGYIRLRLKFKVSAVLSGHSALIKYKIIIKNPPIEFAQTLQKSHPQK